MKFKTVKTIFLKDAHLSELKDKEMIAIKVRIIVASGGKEGGSEKRRRHEKRKGRKEGRKGTFLSKGWDKQET